MIENPMVIDSKWRHLEQESKVVGECAGCQGDITKGEDILEFVGFDGETTLIHQDNECTYQYLAEMSICKIAGEE